MCCPHCCGAPELPSHRICLCPLEASVHLELRCQLTNEPQPSGAPCLRWDAALSHRRCWQGRPGGCPQRDGQILPAMSTSNPGKVWKILLCCHGLSLGPSQILFSSPAEPGRHTHRVSLGTAGALWWQSRSHSLLSVPLPSGHQAGAAQSPGWSWAHKPSVAADSELGMALKSEASS